MPSYFDLSKPAPVLSYLPYISFGGETGLWHDNTSTPDGNGGWLANKRELPPGFVFCLDFGSAESGPIEFSKPPRFEYLRPFGQPEIDIASLNLPPDHKFRPGIRVKVIVKGCGLRELSTNSEGVCREVRRLWDTFSLAQEAMNGQLLCVRVLPSRSYVSKKMSRTYFAPVFEIVGWIDRHPVLGPRTVPLPKPLNLPQLDIDRVHQERLSQDIRYNAAPAKPTQQTAEPVAQPSPPPPQFDPDLNDVIPF